MQVILAGNLVTHIYLGLNEVLRAAGYPQKAMAATLMAVLVHCVVRMPFFIFVLDWGVRGAAYATVLAQVSALSWELMHFFNPKSFLHFQKGIFGLKKEA